MAYAQELKNLAAEIKTGHKNRTARIGEIKRETRDILGEADDYMKRVAAELKEMAGDLKNFLAKSEDTRKKDFDEMIKGIQTKIREIQGDTKDFLAESEEKRMADFRATMKSVTGKVNEIRASVKGLLGGYRTERKEAAGYWARISSRKTKEEKEEKEEEEEEKFKCKVCGKEFDSKIALVGHSRSHKKKKKK